ncbi:MAG: tripartite tricarboxylate transporter permease, partial [Chloroflexota bacterium]
ISTLVGSSALKGLLSGALGLMLALVGSQALTGVERFTFGSLFLYEGIPLVPLGLGLFALPEMISLAAKGGTIAQKGDVIRGLSNVWQGVLDVGRHWSVVLRSSIIGFIVGVVPGVGGETATFVAYGQAKKTSQHPELFGTGSVEGVIAPETANNGKSAGALLTTLSLGIPGDSPSAFVLAAMVVLGIVPGPEMMTRYLDLSLTLFWLVLVAGVIGSAICLVLAPQLAKLSLVPGRVLAPLILVVVFVGSFSYLQRIEDVIVLVITGTVALFLKRHNYSMPALFLGYVLGNYFENYFFLALKTSGPLFFLTPVNVGIILVIIALFAYGPIKNAIERRRSQAA